MKCGIESCPEHPTSCPFCVEKDAEIERLKEMNCTTEQCTAVRLLTAAVEREEKARIAAAMDRDQAVTSMLTAEKERDEAIESRTRRMGRVRELEGRCKRLEQERNRIHDKLEAVERERDALAERVRALEGALDSLLLLVDHETGLPEEAANGNLGPSGYLDEGVVLASKIMEAARAALSPESREEESHE